VNVVLPVGFATVVVGCAVATVAVGFVVWKGAGVIPWWAIAGKGLEVFERWAS
jgi:hypothetical protein